MADISAFLVAAGARLRSERIRIGGNQADFGVLGGVTRSSQAEYELGKRPFTVEYLHRLGEAGIDGGYVLTGCRAIDTLDKERSAWLALYDQLEADEIEAIMGMIKVMLARRGPPATIHTPGREFKPQA